MGGSGGGLTDAPQKQNKNKPWAVNMRPSTKWATHERTPARTSRVMALVKVPFKSSVLNVRTFCRSIYCIVLWQLKSEHTSPSSLV